MNSVKGSGTSLALVLSLALMVFALAGCGDDDSSSPKAPANKVLELDGTGDYVSVPFANHNFATFTVEARVKVSSYDLNLHYVSLQQNAYLVLGDWDDGQISTWASGLTPVDAGEGTEPAVTADEWHHFAFSYDGTNQYVLIDGVVALVVPSSGTVTNSASYVSGLKIGSRFTGGSQYVAGQIDEVRIWNIYRTETQIRDNMNKTISAQTGLVGYWNFDSGTAEDLSGNDADGTLEGNAAIVNK
jgi:hypothetical protein